MIHRILLAQAPTAAYPIRKASGMVMPPYDASGITYCHYRNIVISGSKKDTLVFIKCPWMIYDVILF